MKVNKLRFISAMIFMTILLDVLPSVGFVTIGKVSVTTIHIPTIITAIVLGPGYGLITAILFGIVSLFRAMSRETAPLDVLFINPLVSVFPRMCIAVVAGYLYRFLSKLSKRQFKPVSVALAALAGSLTNSVLVLYSLYVLYPEELVKIFNLPGTHLLARTLVETSKLNTLLEAGISMLVCLVAVYVTQKVTKKLTSEPLTEI